MNGLLFEKDPQCQKDSYKERKQPRVKWCWNRMTITEIGCCGAYCKTCMDWQKRKYPNEKGCLGCKLGYEMGKRDLSKAKCEIKVCCFRDRNLETCADCPEYPCSTLTAFWSKKGAKYQQYKKQLEYIKQHGYEEYLKRADKWTRAAGKLDSP